MKVLLVAERFPPDFAGGGELLVWQTAKNLQIAGVDVTVVTTGKPDHRYYDGIPTVRIAPHRYLLNLASSKIDSLAAGVDVIQTFTYHACLPALRAARRAGKPVVCTVMALFGEEWRSLRHPVPAHLWQWAEKYLVTRPYDRTIYLSETSRSLGARIGAPQDRAQVIPAGLQLDEYWADPQKERVIFFSGKLEARKGIDLLLEIARRRPELRFEVMGWGPGEAGIRARATSNVRFVPFQRGEPLRTRFSKSSIFFFPSRAETFGFVVVEAMASGCAVVSTLDLPFAGSRVAVDDVDAMEASLVKLWNSPELAARAGRDNLVRSREFTWERYTARLLDVYRAVTATETHTAHCHCPDGVSPAR